MYIHIRSFVMALKKSEYILRISYMDCPQTSSSSLLQVVMAAGEVENVAYQFMMNLGRGVEWDPEEFDAVAAVIPAFKFGIVVTVLG